MKKIKELCEHEKDIGCLLFDKDSDTLISAGANEDHQIIFWKYIGNHEWIQLTKIDNKKHIIVMVFNSKSNLLLIGCLGKIKTYVFNPDIPLI